MANLIRLRIDNPYAKGVIKVTPENQELLLRDQLVYIPSPKDKLHKVRFDDTLSNLAYMYYRNSRLWWLIADINKALILNPFDLPVGSSIIIPDLEKNKAFQL